MIRQYPRQADRRPVVHVAITPTDEHTYRGRTCRCDPLELSSLCGKYRVRVHGMRVRRSRKVWAGWIDE